MLKGRQIKYEINVDSLFLRAQNGYYFLSTTKDCLLYKVVFYIQAHGIGAYIIKKHTAYHTTGSIHSILKYVHAHGVD
jgi:hypothetical protein